MTAGDWLSVLDPNEEVAALPVPVREEMIGVSAAWRDDYVVVKGWSEGTAILQEAMGEAGDGDRVKARFFAQLEPRSEDWALRMLHSAHVLKGAGDDSDHGVCLGADQQGSGQRGTATRT